MKKTLALISLLASFSFALAQDEPKEVKPDEPVLVTVSSKGSDVRGVLHDMFKQAGKSFVLGPDIRYYLYLSLEKIEFEEALALVLKMASLKVEVQNGIYFIEKPKAAAPAVKGTFEAKPTPPKGKLPEAVLAKKITTRFDKVDFKVLIASLSQQTGVAFEIAPEVPSYKLDAYLINTSLKYALDTVCKATKLAYKFTENQTIAIAKAEPENRVAIVPGGN